jgi:hypothetical protein
VFRRRQVNNHSRMAAQELGESFGHLRMAASHAADGASVALAPRVDAARKTVRPTVERARDAAAGGMESLLDAARDSRRTAQKKARKTNAKAQKKVSKAANSALSRIGKQDKRSMSGTRKWPLVIGGLLAAGAAIGATSALVKRRRSQPTWEEYTNDSTRRTGDADALLDSAKSTMDAGIDKASAAAGAVKDRTSDLIGSPGKGQNNGPTGIDKTADLNGRG